MLLKAPRSILCSLNNIKPEIWDFLQLHAYSFFVFLVLLYKLKSKKHIPDINTTFKMKNKFHKLTNFYPSSYLFISHLGPLVLLGPHRSTIRS